MGKSQLIFISIVSFAVISGFIFSLYERSTENSHVPSMSYVDFCNYKDKCKKLSRLVMGTDHLQHDDWTQPGQKSMSEDDLFKLLDETVKRGINTFDTSRIYVGAIEKKLGKWIALRKEQIKKDDFYYDSSFNPDRKIYVISKGGFPHDLYFDLKLPLTEYSPALKEYLSMNETLSVEGLVKEKLTPGTYASKLFGEPENIRKNLTTEIEDSFNNLQGLKIDIYLLHRDDFDFINYSKLDRQQNDVKKILTALSHSSFKDFVGAFGLSNWSTDRTKTAFELSDKHEDLVTPVMSSSYFSLFEMSGKPIHAGGDQFKHKDMLNEDFLKGMLLMPYSPLGGFSILDKPEPKWENARASARLKAGLINGASPDPYWQNVYSSIFNDGGFNEKRYHRAKTFLKDFNEKNNTKYTLDQLLNAYVLAHPRTDMLAIGPITIEQLKRTNASLELATLLNKKDLAYLQQK